VGWACRFWQGGPHFEEARADFGDADAEIDELIAFEDVVLGACSAGAQGAEADHFAEIIDDRAAAVAAVRRRVGGQDVGAGLHIAEGVADVALAVIEHAPRTTLELPTT